MKIEVPRLSTSNALGFSRDLQGYDYDVTYFFDVSKINNYEPLPMLLTAASIRQFCEQRDLAPWDIQLLYNENKNYDYACHMGFFQAAGFPQGKATATEQREETIAQEINEQHRERMSNFTFSACEIAIGEQIEFYCNGNEHTGELCEVVDDKHVSYNGETWSLTALAKYLMGTKNPLAGPQYFKYKGEWLNTIRKG